MHESNWIGRITVVVFIFVLLGLLVLGYIGSKRTPSQQHYDQAITIPQS